MATSVKSKFAGLLRGLLRPFDDRASASTAPAAAPAVTSTRPVSSVATAQENNAESTRPIVTNGIELPLAPIIAALPMELRAKLMAAPPSGSTICLPVETVVGQLAFGAVKISFGELRQLAPGIFANSGGEHDNRPVSLPLSEILARINPALLARRTAPTTEVSDEIAGPFGARGQGITFTTQPLKAAPAAPVQPEPESVSTPPMTPPSQSVLFTPLQRPLTPPTLPMTFPPRETAPTVFTPPPKLTTNGNGNGNGNGHTNGNGHGNGHNIPSIGLKFTAAPVPAPVSPVSRLEPVQTAATSTQTIFVSLADLAESWPEELRNEITRSNLANESVPLLVAQVEPGLKRGRVTMTWKQLRTLTKPSSSPSPNDGLELELSLKVLAPIFMAAQKNLSRPGRKLAVSSEIPNLFFGFPQPAAPVAETPAAPAPIAVNRLEGKLPDTNYFTREPEAETEFSRAEAPATDFLSRLAPPKEIVKRALSLSGVAGAVVALPDGLRVASEVPLDLNADTLAAFLPQIFERVNQSTRELRMGALNNVSFTVGNTPWKIFRVSSVYFAAFGRAGESLPTAQLAQLAQELDRKKSS